MGPYCNFCGHRCFVRIPAGAPKHIVNEYYEKVGVLPLMATCPRGQKYELATIGYCYDDAVRASRSQEEE